MGWHQLQREQWLPVSIEEAWAFFCDPRNLEEITPPELGFRIESLDEGEMFEGQIIIYRIRVAPGIWLRWVTEIKSVVPGRAFVDEQRSGPYKIWHHRHSFEEVEGGVRMRDVVHYDVGWGPLGGIAHGLYVKRQLRRIFDFRHEVIEKHFGGGTA